MFGIRALVGFAICLLAALVARAGELAADSQGTLTYPSATYDNLVKLMHGAPTQAVTAEGVLRLPPGEGKVAAVVLLHTIGGRSEGNEGWFASKLVEAGYAVFMPDTFGPRGWREMGTKGGGQLAASQTADAFNALTLLSGHPRIDAGRIAVAGFSLGGDSAQFTAFEPLRRALLPEGRRYAAHVPFYPAAVWGIVSGPDSFTGAPVHFELAGNEDAGPLSKVLPYLDYIRRGGAAVDHVVHSGAYHAWTEGRFVPSRHNPNLSSARACPTLLLNPAGPLRELTLDGQERETTVEAWRPCLQDSRGYTMGFDAGVRSRSLDDMLDFLKSAMN
jgi:dienelactone hydrolase